MPQTRLTISEIADLLGIAPKTIRHYHDIGVLPEPVRAENGYRLYSGADLRRLHTIRELQGYGLSLRQIKFVLETDEPDVHLRAFLAQRDADLAAEIFRLQQQQERVRNFLNGDPTRTGSQTPSHEILHQVVKPLSSSLADILRQVEGQTLDELDRLPHDSRYADFWEQAGAQLAQSLLPHEHQFILWLERYLALANMAEDDRQAQAWLRELRHSPAASLLPQALDFPDSDLLPVEEQQQIRRLIPLLLYEQATPLQQAFIMALTQGRTR
jgi:DNA-binding transcriptional MerR regulator